MLTILKPKSYQALQEIEGFLFSLQKAGIEELPEVSDAPGAERSGQILTWDSREAERLKAEFPRAKIHVLSPGVDTRVRVLREEARPYDVLRILTVLDINQENGFDDAVRLLHSLGDIDWHWYIVGEPMDEYYFEVLTVKFDEWGWEDKVTFVGRFGLEERIHLAVNMDVALYLPKVSPLGLALLEQIQMGLPILTTDVGPARAILGEDEDSAFFADRDSARDFIMKYAGRSETKRKKRDHPLLQRKWSQVASEYRALSAGIPSD